MTREEEIQLVHNLLLHPAGFDIDIAGLLWVRQYEWPRWAVEWEVHGHTDLHVEEFDSALDAATFFVNMRHERELGLDFEQMSMQVNKNFKDWKKAATAQFHLHGMVWIGTVEVIGKAVVKEAYQAGEDPIRFADRIYKQLIGNDR
jgi:hypothetical protein